MTGLGNSGYQSTGRAVGGQDQRVPGGGSFADQLIQVVGLRGGELAHGEVVEDEDGGADVFAQAAVPGAVGVAAGQVREGAAGFGEPDVGAGPDGEVAEGLGDVALADADRAVEDHGLAGVQPAQRGQIADLGGGELGAGVEVEAFQGGLLVEAGPADAADHRHGLAAADLVVAEDLQEVQVAEFTGGGLGQAGVEGLEHAGQLEGAQALAQRGLQDCSSGGSGGGAGEQQRGAVQERRGRRRRRRAAGLVLLPARPRGCP